MDSLKSKPMSLWLSCAAAVILALLPLHAFFTTWLGSNFGHLDAFRIWKELALVPLALLTWPLLVRHRELWRWLSQSNLLRLIGLYVFLHFAAAGAAYLYDRVNAPAAIYALLSNLRYIGFFLICLTLASYHDLLARRWRQIVLGAAVVTVIFGLLQVVLPADFLTHFGYGETTIPAYHTVDDKLEYQRIQSTLRGPNPFGAYLVLIIPLLLAAVLKPARRRPLFFLGASLAALFYTYSRSAWLGLTLAVSLMLYWQLRSRRLKRRLLYILAGAVVLFGGLTLSLRNNDRWQNIVFHSDENSAAATSSNEDRLSHLTKGLNDIWDHPWGTGPGTAGPASFRNDNGPRIAENYFIQVGQEVGIIGLTLFIGITLLVGLGLWRRHDELSLALLAALAGVTLINMFSHAWGDDTLGLMWWGLAGIALARPKVKSHSRLKSS